MSNPDQSLVAQWNEVMLEAIREGSAKPTATTYELHLVTAAIYDAWAALDADAYGHYSEIGTSLAATEANKEEAISFAAYQMLSVVLPSGQQKYDTFMAELGFDATDASTDTNTAAGLGNTAAANVLDARAEDGSNFENDFADTTGYVPVNDPEPGSAGAPGGAIFDPNQWQPLRVPNGTLTDENGVPVFDNNDPSTFDDQSALTPQWGSVDAFALSSGDQFRPDAPPQLGDNTAYTDGAGNVTTGDQAYRDQIAEVVEISANLTTEQKVIAEFWADGPRTESPPGHWNQIAQDIALREGHGNDEDAKLFFAMNAAVFDAGIATWEAKYHYNYVRPQSAIRDLFHGEQIESWGGPNEGTQTILGQEWQPYQNVTFVTPPFPEYVSGHSTFSMAAAKTIAAFVGSDQFFDGTTEGNYDLDTVEGVDLLGQFVTDELAFEDFDQTEPVVLQWETLTEAAEEAGISRLYGGIHIQDGNLNGLEVGREVAANAEIRWDALFTRGGNDFVFGDLEGGLEILGAGSDRFRGRRDAEDFVEGGSGRDDIRTHRGNDVALGEAGFDRIFTGDGEDVISGGDDLDFIRGGAGADTMVFFQGETGIDFLADFDASEDQLVFVGFGEGAELETREFRGSTFVSVDGESVARLIRTDADDLSVGENVFFEDSFVF